jgi:hypothetical protein
VSDQGENASLARQVESMAMRIESLAEELSKPEDVRLREVLDALDGRAVIFDGLGARVGHLLDEMDEWIGRAGEAERMVEAARRSLSSVAESMTEHAYHLSPNVMCRKKAKGKTMTTKFEVQRINEVVYGGYPVEKHAERDPEKQFRMVMEVIREYLIDLDHDIEGCDADDLRNIEAETVACYRLRARIVAHVCEGKDARGQ